MYFNNHNKIKIKIQTEIYLEKSAKYLKNKPHTFKQPETKEELARKKQKYSYFNQYKTQRAKYV